MKAFLAATHRSEYQVMMETADLSTGSVKITENKLIYKVDVVIKPKLPMKFEPNELICDVRKSDFAVIRTETIYPNPSEKK